MSRARGILHICKLHGHRRLVLGAWGCGARKHPPQLVVESFERALSELGAHSGDPPFSQVIFAIKKDQRAEKAFREVFDSDVQGVGTDAVTATDCDPT